MHALTRSYGTAQAATAGAPSHLDHVVTHDHGQGSVDGGGHVSAAEVDGHQGLVGDGQHVLHGAVGGLTEGVVHLLGEGLLLGLWGERTRGEERLSGGGEGRQTGMDNLQYLLECQACVAVLPTPVQLASI